MSGDPERAELIERAGHLGVRLEDRAATDLLRLVEELMRWSKAYNLTGIRSRAQILTRHILDSLSIEADLRGRAIADVGTGAGFPGLPLAVVSPGRRFTLIDSNGKKVRFVEHAARILGLENVEVVKARVEAWQPVAAYDTVIARAFAPLPELLARVRNLVGPQTRVLAMKGQFPAGELAAVKPPWRVVHTRSLAVPGLEEARHVVWIECASPCPPVGLNPPRAAS